MKILISITILLSSLSLSAQQDFLLFNMQDVPQSTYTNPSNRYDGKLHIGIPAISSNYFSFSNTGAAYSDFVIKRNNELVLSFDNLIDNLEDENYLSVNSRIDLLSFGYSLNKKMQLTFNVSEVISMKMGYPVDLIRFIYNGNASFEDNEANLDGIGLNFNHYREFGANLSWQFNDKLRLGGRVKYLQGMENIYTETSDITITTNAETYALTANTDFVMRTSGINDIGDEDYAFFESKGNSGLGFDLGANYKLNDKWSFNASLLDLGFISWKNDINNYKSKGSYTYDGIELDVFADEDDETAAKNDDNTSFDRVLDSLEKELGVIEDQEEYNAPLTSRIYLNANYSINEKSFAGAIIQSEIFKSRLYPSFTLSYGRKMNSLLTLTGAYTIINRSFNNLGLGLSLNPGPIQIYIMSDNLLGTFQPQHTRHVQLRFGINLIFGREKSESIFYNN